MLSGSAVAPFHRRNTGRCAKRLVILLALLLYLHHAGGIILLACRNVVAADAVNIAELAYTDFTCHTFIADEVMLREAVLRYSDNRGRIDGVILRFVEFQCKPNAEQARLFC